jgi:hypothetical protein
MKRFLFAVAVVALSACAGSAEDKPAVVTTAPATPVVGTAAPVVEYAPAQTTRRGLFGRLRNRGTTPATYSAPVMTAPAPASTTPPVAAPMPMPGTKTSTARPMNGQIVQASGNLPPGTYTTTDGTIVQIGGTQSMTSTSMSSPQPARQGLFSRLRNR